LARPLAQDAINAMRKLYQINRVETATAVMSEFVLVPEGKLDFDWLSLITRIVELGSETNEACLFGVRVGLIPTSDAKVTETCEAISRAHPGVCALVDGDADGDRYAGALRDPAVGVRKVLRWPDGWMIEDVVCWILQADEAAAMQRINADLAAAPGDRVTLLARLKSEDRAQNGLKGDLVAYEIISNALADRALCLARARSVLHAIAQASAGIDTPHFEIAEADGVPLLIFRL
jgi:putative ATP-dependent endonuclease of OLD family